MARTVKCPSCGAELTVKDDNRDFMFCEFCGTKVRLDDYQETHRYVDEARIQESKDAKEVELKKLEYDAQKRHEETIKNVAPLILVAALMGFAMILAILSELGIL